MVEKIFEKAKEAVAEEISKGNFTLNFLDLQKNGRVKIKKIGNIRTPLGNISIKTVYRNGEISYDFSDFTLSLSTGTVEKGDYSYSERYLLSERFEIDGKTYARLVYENLIEMFKTDELDLSAILEEKDENE